jgi:hypothetical protein
LPCGLDFAACDGSIPASPNSTDAPHRWSVVQTDKLLRGEARLGDGCDARCSMIMNYLPLISATVIMLVILAFAAEASSQ